MQGTPSLVEEHDEHFAPNPRFGGDIRPAQPRGPQLPDVTDALIPIRYLELIIRDVHQRRHEGPRLEDADEQVDRAAEPSSAPTDRRTVEPGDPDPGDPFAEGSTEPAVAENEVAYRRYAEEMACHGVRA